METRGFSCSHCQAGSHNCTSVLPSTPRNFLWRPAVCTCSPYGKYRRACGAAGLVVLIACPGEDPFLEGKAHLSRGSCALLLGVEWLGHTLPWWSSLG